MILEAQQKTIELLQVINNKNYRGLVEKIGIPISMLRINKVNLDWNQIYEKVGKDAFPFAANTFRDIPESGLLTSNDLFLSSQELNGELKQFIESIGNKVPHEKLDLDFLFNHLNLYSTYWDNIVALYNPSATMVLQDKEKNEYYFRKVNTSIDGKSLTEKGLYKLGKKQPLSLIPDGASH